MESGGEFLVQRILNLETKEKAKLSLTIEQENSQETRRNNSIKKKREKKVIMKVHDKCFQEISIGRK